MRTEQARTADWDDQLPVRIAGFLAEIGASEIVLRREGAEAHVLTARKTDLPGVLRGGSPGQRGQIRIGCARPLLEIVLEPGKGATLETLVEAVRARWHTTVCDAV